MEIKDQLRVAYNADAKRRVDNEKSRDKWKLDCREKFAKLLSKHKLQTILELGSGVGIDAKYFQDMGFDITATDLSENMVAQCQKKGLKSKVLDVYELDSTNKKYDGIYSLNVLLHTPRKDIRKVLNIIKNSMSESGIFFYGVYGGVDEEKIIVDKTKMGLPRYFSFLSDESIQSLAKEYFEILSFETIDIGSDQPGFHFQSLFLQKK